MNDLRNRDRPATQLTKREHAAIEAMKHLWNFHATPDGTRVVHADLAARAVDVADKLFDALDTPPELRDDPRHETNP